MGELNGVPASQTPWPRALEQPEAGETRAPLSALALCIWPTGRLPIPRHPKPPGARSLSEATD